METEVAFRESPSSAVGPPSEVHIFLTPKQEKNSQCFARARSRELAAEIAQSILTSAIILPQSLQFCYFLGGVKPLTFLTWAYEEWEFICSARNQKIYWRIALLAYDEPIKPLRGSVKMTGTQKQVRANTFATPKKTCFGVWITMA